MDSFGLVVMTQAVTAYWLTFAVFLVIVPIGYLVVRFIKKIQVKREFQYGVGVFSRRKKLLGRFTTHMLP